MNRLEEMDKSDVLSGKRIIVAGCGYKPLQHKFYDITTGEPSHDSMEVYGQEMKLNIGSAVAGVLALNGANVHMVSRSEDKLENIREYLAKITEDEELIECSALDVLDEKEVHDFVRCLPGDKPLYWAQSVGLGAGSYELKDDNPYLPIEEIPLDLVEKESQIVLRSTHLMMKELLPRFREQNETRIAVISSMSAIRGYSYGGAHCAAKGAIDRYANAAMLGLYRDNIFVTSIRPGAVDTGMYDGEVVREAVKDAADEYKCPWRENGIRLAPPTSVGEAVKYVFTATAHIPSLNIVAKGQFPNEGS
jgi:NAD(P)-dependent dehydrogenase (short-subunit alcohol dehydrogenase family)